MLTITKEQKGNGAPEAPRAGWGVSPDLIAERADRFDDVCAAEARRRTSADPVHELRRTTQSSGE
jgi:hypothetical protein